MGQEDPWRRKWQPTPVFLPRKPHGQRNLAGYSPWGCTVRYDLASKQEVFIKLNKLTSIPSFLRVGVHAFFPLWFSLGICSGVVFESYGSSIFIFLRNLHT